MDMQMGRGGRSFDRGWQYAWDNDVRGRGVKELIWVEVLRNGIEGLAVQVTILS